MAGLGIDFAASGLVLILAVIFVIAGLILAIFVFFKRADCLTEDDKLHYKRATLLWIGAASLSLVAIYAATKEKHHHRKGLGLSLGVSSSPSRSASLL